jgi:hypothetical protein
VVKKTTKRKVKKWVTPVFYSAFMRY